MKNNIIFIITLILVTALTVYNTFTLGKIKDKPIVMPTFNQQIVQSPKIVQSDRYDQVGNLIVSNKLRFEPILTVDNSLLSRGIGDVWNDATNEALRYWDGNYPQGTEIAMGKFGYDDLVFHYGVDDTLEYPPLLDLGYNVSWEILYDSINSGHVLIDIQDAENDTMWKSFTSGMGTDAFPDTLIQTSPRLGLMYVSQFVKYLNRVIIDFDTATFGEVTVRRRIGLLK